MFVGDINRISLGVSSFEAIMTNGFLFVDKSLFIQHFLKESPGIHLIARQRRVGKSLNLDMLRCFLTDQEDYRPLFENLQIRGSDVWERAHSAPVFLFDFKSLSRDKYVLQIHTMITNYLFDYANDPKCPPIFRFEYENWIAGKYAETDGLLLLTKIAYAITGKKSYVFIDEYDELLMNNMKNDCYDDMRDFMTLLFSAGFKGNNYLEKGLLTGVTRLSYEGMLSGLNNLITYDVFRDSAYTDDYGLSETEMTQLSAAAGFDLDEARRWYNGVKVGGRPIYNMYSVMNMLHFHKFDYYWAASGSMGVIVSIMSAGQKQAIIEMLVDEVMKTVSIEEKISPKQLVLKGTDSMFYSFLIQCGYLSLEEKFETVGNVTIPNIELKKVWQRFLLTNLFNEENRVGHLFTHIYDPERLSACIQTYLSHTLDTLSYYDLPRSKGKDGKLRVPENSYHLLLYAILTSAKDKFGCTSISSNRESGDGRYDILVEFNDMVVIFEIKSAADDEDMEQLASAALRQIGDMRYGADLGKPITGIGCAFRRKTCVAAAGEI